MSGRTAAGTTGALTVVVAGPEAAAVRGADLVAEALASRARPVLGLATGSSPAALYAELVRRHRSGLMTFRDAAAVLLDEYVGLPPAHPERYAAVIRRELVDHVDLVPGAVHGLDGDARTVEAVRAETTRYEGLLDELGGVDLQVLGVGRDGHIAFNMPGTAFDSRTHLTQLSADTRAANARFFGGDVDAVPRTVLTQGIGTILQARWIVVLAAGASKAEAVRRMVTEAPDPAWPASGLQLHPRVTVLVDPAAAGAL